MTDTPRIYVACLASYNAGILHGAWIDLESTDPDDYADEIQAMLAASPFAGAAEEYAIHDHEGLPDNVGEFTSLSDICAILAFYEKCAEHGIDDPRDAAAISDYFGADYALSMLEDNFYGVYKDKEDWAYQWIDDTGMLGDCPETLKSYFDYEKFARDAFMSDMSDVDLPSGGIAVFRN